jgi:spore germination cell wall hydrolase CwlJ-like protein
MAARWVGLSRPHKKKTAARAAVRRGVIQDCIHALGAGGVLIMAAALNFAMYPDALAAVVSGERAIVGFVPEEPGGIAAPPVGPVVVDEMEVRLLAATAWGEARSEGEDGMRAVAHVMVNRIGERFGEDLATVILSPKQFSVWNRGDPNRRLVQNFVANPDPDVTGDAQWETAERVAREVLSGQSVDPTGGALFYHTRAIRPRWSRQGVGRQEIGAHVFYADVPDPGVRDTPRAIEVAQFFGRALNIGGSSADRAERSERAAGARRGPRAGRVNGVIQHAPASTARQELPSETANAAATPTLNGVPISDVQHGAAAGATP